MSRFSDITSLDWEILNALADDYGSIEQIQSIISGFAGISPTRQDILDRLEYLHQKHYVFLILNKTFDRSKLLDEIEEKTKDRSYWFGRTEIGYLACEELTEKYLKQTEQGVAANRLQRHASCFRFATGRSRAAAGGG